MTVIVRCVVNLESAARGLRMLGTRERLSPSELDRGKGLMVELKKLEIVEAIRFHAGLTTISTLAGRAV